MFAGWGGGEGARGSEIGRRVVEVMGGLGGSGSGTVSVVVAVAVVVVLPGSLIKLRVSGGKRR